MTYDVETILNPAVQMTLDEAASREACDEAVQRVDDHADDWWKVAADDAFVTCAARYQTFTTDQVWELLDRRSVLRPTEPRAMGPRARSAVQRGVIEPTGDYRPSERPETHRNPKRVYRSLL